MKIPGFNAARSLSPTIGTYWGSALVAGLSKGEVSMQQFRSPFFRGRFGT